MTAMPGIDNDGEMPIRNFTGVWSPDGSTMTLAIRKAPAAGTYEVRWQAAAADGHMITWTFEFAVR